MGGDIVKSWQTKPTSRKSDVIVCSSPLSVLLNVFFLFFKVIPEYMKSVSKKYACLEKRVRWVKVWV